MFKRLKETLESPDAFVSLVLGLAVVFVIGIMIFRYVKGKTPQTAQKPEEKQTQETPTDGTAPINVPPGGAYTVKEGDTLWNIAGRQYNNSYQWVEIAKANALPNPDLILIGQQLTLPKVEMKGETSSTSTDGKPKQSSYTVVAGDTLWDIGRNMYGNGYKWTDIAGANKLANPDLIHPGNVLTLP